MSDEKKSLNIDIVYPVASSDITCAIRASHGDRSVIIPTSHMMLVIGSIERVCGVLGVEVVHSDGRPL